MEFSIDLHTTLFGEITIEDFSKEYGLYLEEDTEVVTSFDKYKYSESATLNTVLKVNIGEMILKDVLLNEHTEDIDSCTFSVDKDGYYVIEHIILPNKKWYENASSEYKEYYETIYIIDELEEKIYKEVDNELVECSVKELLERNVEGTTIKKCKVEVFYTGHLLQCYINYCKSIFNNLLTTCPVYNYDELIYNRDFIWMTLNIIDYLIGFKLFMEAERILNVFNNCNGVCNINYDHKNTNSCGCS